MLKGDSTFGHLHQKGLAHPPPDDVVCFYISRHALIGLCEYMQSQTGFRRHALRLNTEY